MMYVHVVNALAQITPDHPPLSPQALAPPATAQTRARLLELTQLRHARYCAFSTAIGEVAVRGLLPLARGERRAVLTAGTDLHVAVATAFGRRLAEAGPRRLNPIMFPHTLASATAVSLAAQFGAHVCAVAMEGPGSLSRALLAADVLLRGAADEVMVFAVEPGETAEGEPCGTMTGLGLLITHQAQEGAAAFERPQPGAPGRSPQAEALDLAQRLATARSA